MNITEEERQAMFEEMQQKLIDACQGKTEGDVCQVEGFRSNVNGSCEIRNDSLICFSNRSMEPRRP